MIIMEFKFEMINSWQSDSGSVTSEQFTTKKKFADLQDLDSKMALHTASMYL